LKIAKKALKRSMATLLGHDSDPLVASGTGCTAFAETVSVTHMNVEFTQATMSQSGRMPTSQSGRMPTSQTKTAIGKSSGTCFQVNNETVQIYGELYGKVIDCDLTLEFDGSGGMQKGTLFVSREYDAGDNVNGMSSELDVTGGTGNYEGANGTAFHSMDGNWDYKLAVGCD
jgi:hypothetical protein